MAHYDPNGMKLKNVPILTYRDHVTYRENCHPHAFYLNFVPFKYHGSHRKDAIMILDKSITL